MENASIIKQAGISEEMVNQLNLINEIVEEIINECKDVDDTVMAYANVYFNDSKRILESIEENESDKVTKEKLKEAIANAAVGAVIKGAGDVVNAINTIDQANTLLVRKKEIAAKRLPRIDKAIEMANHVCDSYRKGVMAYADVYYNFNEKEEEIKNNTENIKLFEDILKTTNPSIKLENKDNIEELVENIKRKNNVSLTALAMYRKTLLNSYTLEFLKSEFNAWTNDKHDTDEMESPSLEIINYYILTNDFYPLSNADLKNNLAISSKVVKTASKILTGGKANIDGRFMYILADEQLLATVLSHLEDATMLVQNNENVDPIINNILGDNDTYNKLMNFGNIATGFASGLKRRNYLYITNVILAILAIILGLYNLADWNTWVKIFVGIILAGYCIYKTIQVAAEMDDIYELKKNTFNLYIVNSLRNIAGYAPKQVTITEKVEKSHSTIIGAIIGGILGFFFLPFPGGLLVGAFIMAALFAGGSDNHNGKSDGSEYVNIKYGVPWKAFIIFLGLLFFIMLIFA